MDRVYSAEGTWREDYWTSTPTPFTSIEEAKVFLNNVLSYPEIRHRFGGAADLVRANLQVGKLDGYGEAVMGETIVGECTINLAEHALDEHVALHELSHLLTFVETFDGNHGENFTNTLLNLVDAVIGPDAASDLASRYKHNEAEYVELPCEACPAQPTSITAGQPESAWRNTTWRRPPMCDSCLTGKDMQVGTEGDVNQWIELRSLLARRRKDKWEYEKQWRIDGYPDDFEAALADINQNLEKGSTALLEECDQMEGLANNLLDPAFDILRSNDTLSHHMTKRLLDANPTYGDAFALEPEVITECVKILNDIAESGDYSYSQQARDAAALFEAAVAVLEAYRQVLSDALDVVSHELGRPSEIGQVLALHKMADGFVYTADEQRWLGMEAST